MEFEELFNRQDIPRDVKDAIQRKIKSINQIEHELRESEEKYRNLIERANDGIALIQDSLIKYVNPGLVKITGYTADELLDTPFMDYIHPDFRSEVVNRYEQRMAGQSISSIYETTFLLKNNKLIEVEINAGIIPYQGKQADLAIIRDISKHKKAEEELRESKEKYQMLVEKLEEGVLLEDAKGFISFINPKTGKLLSYTKEELIGKHWSSIVPSEYIDQIYNETAKRPKGYRTTYEASLLAKDGNQIPVIITATPVFSPKEEFEGVLSVFTDITQRKAVEQKLRESEERYRSYVENARDIIFTISPDGILTSINPIVESITGFAQNEWIGKPFSPLVHEDDFPIIIDGFRRVLEGDRLSPAEMRLLTKSGDYITVEIKASAQVSEAGELVGMLGIARNITERKQAEEALRQLKLEEERFHAMMSHFINNDMQKIINNIELLSLMYESNLELDNNIINQIITIASNSSKTIDTVNKIFEVLQTPFNQPKDSVKLLNMINEVVSELPAASKFININKKTLDARAFIDTRFKDVINELLTFILSSYDEIICIEKNINITGSYFPSFYCVYISDFCSEPLPQEIILKLSGTITDEWEIIGHNIGIALASVIMQYYGGLLKIQSVNPKGNVFELRFPRELISS